MSSEWYLKLKPSHIKYTIIDQIVIETGESENFPFQVLQQY